MRRLAMGLGILVFSARMAQATPLLIAWDHGVPPYQLLSVRIANGEVIQAEDPLTPLPADQCRAQDKAYKDGISRCAAIECTPESFYTLSLKAGNGPANNTIYFGTDAQCRLVDAEQSFADAMQHEREVKPAPIPDEADAAPIPTEAEASPAPAVPPIPIASPIVAPPSPSPVTTHPRPPSPSTPAVAAGTNILPAATAQQPWAGGSFAGTQASASLDQMVQRQGRPTQRLTGHGDYFAQSSSPSFAVEAGRTYEVSAWVKLQGTTKLVEVDVFYWDAHGNQLKAWGEAIGGRLNGTRDWTQLHGDVTVPAQAARAVVQIRVMSQGGRAWVDDVQMRAKGEGGVVAQAPPREMAETPAHPGLPDKPLPPEALPKPIPAQSREGLLEQFQVLEDDYQAREKVIRQQYETTLKALEKDRSSAAQQQREHAYTAGSKALTDLYEAILAAWEVLAAQWELVP